MFKVCHPINWFRGGLFTIMTGGFLYCLFFYPTFFNILPLDKVSILIVFVLAIDSFYVYKVINYLVTAIFHKFDKTIAVESNIYKVN